ncbi:carbamoyltransferase HypF [Saccharothrix syringae]|uniref:carbamoyltransferase HypF n=1 Tax=Saccharothrix syringae TaxID=103733 RepID=UPI001B803785|nr:carbamoyltransferase HypF [Saccharothrix syringae]
MDAGKARRRVEPTEAGGAGTGGAEQHVEAGSAAGARRPDEVSGTAGTRQPGEVNGTPGARHPGEISSTAGTRQPGEISGTAGTRQPGETSGTAGARQPAEAGGANKARRRVERIEVSGAVQGVGFRPHVHRLAASLGIDGDVRDVDGHVVITAAGRPHDLAEFHRLVRDRPPPVARVDRVVVSSLPASAAPPPGFREGGPADDAGVRSLPPDLATCPACVADLFTPTDRHYRYPFTTCSRCGPRATIVEALPYDRERTTMRGFRMCADCAAEYADPADRRFHAEPVACPACGPVLWWGALAGEDALRAAEAVVAGGGLVAVKGVGGYQLVCDAADEAAVLRLRRAKGRPREPFAVMAPSPAAVRELATGVDEAVLVSPAAPVALLPRRPGARLAPSVAPGLAEVGLCLPHSPLHHLLLADLARPLVVTGGNRSGDPLVTDDGEALTSLGPLVDGVLGHDRPIRSGYADSVVRGPALVRRARGYAPEPLPLPVTAPEPVLALGARLRHTAAVAVGGLAVVGPQNGDLSDWRGLAAFEASARALCLVPDVRPAYCAHDPDPGCPSTRHALGWPPGRRIAVQHHHAHVAATAAEHGVAGPFIGVAYDGLGQGDDGTLWGGEVLLADYLGYRRVGRIGTAPLPGGEVAVRRPARMALGYLLGAEDFGAHPVGDDLLRRVGPAEAELARRMIARGVDSPVASSVGRLFDAAAALLGVCDDNTYDGEAAALLEAAAAGLPAGEPLSWRLHHRDGLWVYDPVPTLRDAVTAGEPVGAVSARFHTTVAHATRALVGRVADDAGVRVVCLGGGVFRNSRLTGEVVRGLAEDGFEVHVGARVPVDDGGISYGQAAVAAARLAKG